MSEIIFILSKQEKSIVQKKNLLCFLFPLSFFCSLSASQFWQVLQMQKGLWFATFGSSRCCLSNYRGSLSPSRVSMDFMCLNVSIDQILLQSIIRLGALSAIDHSMSRFSSIRNYLMFTRCLCWPIDYLQRSIALRRRSMMASQRDVFLSNLALYRMVALAFWYSRNVSADQINIVSED